MNWFKIAFIATVLAIAVGSYWYTYNAGIRHQQDVQAIEIAKSNELATKNFNTIWDLYITESNKKHVQYKIIKQEVEKIVDRPVYRNICLDDEGVELANKAIRGDTK